MEAKKQGLRLSDGSAEKIGELICAMVDKCTQDWKQPWLTQTLGDPQAFASKKEYNGINAFLLGMLQSIKGYATPYFLTMNNIKDLGLNLNSTSEEAADGSIKQSYEKPFPVFFWRTTHRKGEQWLKDEEYLDLSEDEKGECLNGWVLKVYNVFNLDQTNYAEIYPDKYAKLKPASLEDHQIEVDYKNGVLDYEIMQNGAWRCPISQTSEGRAYYSLSTDSITLPKRDTFKSASEFYGTALHEMTHSTGRELKRDLSGGFGSEQYAKEELVAELTAAIVMNDLGVEKYLKEDSLPYLKGWSKVLKDTNAIRVVMDDVMRAVSYHKKQYAKIEHLLNTEAE